MTPILLLTGFEPFGTYQVNPSWEAAKRFQDRRFGDCTVEVLRLPVTWEGAPCELLENVAARKPRCTILTGLHPRHHIALERVAHNLDDTPEADNAGRIRSETPIEQGGPVAYWSTLPLAEMAKHLKSAGLPVTLSGSAGFYLCNHVFYRLMHHLSQYPAGRGGFIHVPPTPDLDPESPFPLDRIAAALEICLETAASA